MNKELKLLENIISKNNNEVLDILIEHLYTTGKMTIPEIMKIWDGKTKVQSLSQREIFWLLDALSEYIKFNPNPIILKNAFRLTQNNQFCVVLSVDDIMSLEGAGHFNLEYENAMRTSSDKKVSDIAGIADLMSNNEYYHSNEILTNLKDNAEWKYDKRNHTLTINSGTLDVISGAHIIKAIKKVQKNKSVNCSFNMGVSILNEKDLQQILLKNFGGWR